MQKAAANHPDLLVMVNQRRTDHVLSVEDSPHTLNNLRLWSQAAIAFFRLNPDAAYTSHVTGINEAFLPDNPAYAVPEFPTSTSWLMPNEIDGVSLTTALQVGSILELSDRVHFNDVNPNLTRVLGTR